jgi:perosamine synthetase
MAKIFHMNKNLHQRSMLIPRNNWDYGFIPLISAFTHLRSDMAQFTHTEKLFQQPPLWTKSGRVSLYAILKAMDLPAGAHIGVPLFCCSVVFNAICQAGLSPCFLDSNLNDFNLSVEDLHKKRPDLAAVIAVHMFGNPCDMDAINDIAGNRPVIEDCAQSLFSTYKGIQTGLLSTASFFSFRCGKYISAGEGSAIFCNEPPLRQKIAHIVDSFERWSVFSMLLHAGSTYIKATCYNRPWYGLFGYPVGMRLDKKMNLTAKGGFETGKIASTHLALIDRRIAGFQKKITLQREHAQMLLNELEPGKFGLPAENNACSTNWFQVALRFQNTQQRDTMADFLFRRGIDTAKYLDGIADEARSNYGYLGDCPNAEQLSTTTLLVPVHYNLEDSDILHIAHSINAGSQLI